MAKAPRNYRADLNRLLASRRGFDLGADKNRLTYLRRMAAAQAKAEAAGETFKPQAARGHKPQEHRTERRQAGRERYAREQFYARREARQQRWFADRSQRLSGDTMIRQEARWAIKTPDERQRVIDARNYAIARPGVHDWDWYMDAFDIEPDDLELFGYQ